MPLAIRDCTPGDFERMNQIYNSTIVDSHVSFDVEPWDIERRQAWWDARDPRLVCLVAELDGEVVGASHASWYRPKPAYRSSMETTIVLGVSARGKGLGSQLLAALLDRLTADGAHLAVAIIALPNDASVALHHKLGYDSVGVLHEVGHKDGRFIDTMLLEKRLGPG